MSGPREYGRDSIESELGRPVRAPDLTDPVMSRLGLDAAARRKTRRRHAARVLARLGVCGLAVAGTLLVGRLLERRPTPAAFPTLPAALRHDLQHHGQTIDRAIESILELSPGLPGQPGDAAEPHDDQTP